MNAAVRRSLSGLGCVAALALVFGARPFAQASSAADDILARPISPGTIALLVEHANVPAVQVRLGAALRHASPDVRAAAARVLFVTGARGMVAPMTLALAAETSEDAAVEQTRFLAYFGAPDARATVLASWPRLGPRLALRSAVVLAAVEGPQALDHIPTLLSAGVRKAELVDLIRSAARGERDPIERLLLDAVRAADATLGETALRAAGRTPAVPLNGSALDAVLAADQPESLRIAAAWYLVRAWDGAQPITPTAAPRAINVLSARLAAAEQAKEPTHALFFARELLSRASGARPARGGVLNEVLLTADSTVQELVRGNLALKVLSTDEIDRIVRRRGFASNRKRLASGAPPRIAELQAADGYPRGFATGVFDAAGCTPSQESSPRSDGVAGGVVTLREQGRVERVSLMRSRIAQPGCQVAVRVLLENFVEATGAVLRQGEERAVLIPFDASYFACQDAAEPAMPVDEDAAPNVTKPRKTRNVPPRYPQSAIDDKVQGTVVIDATITSKGCISTARVLHGMDPRLDWAGIEAVLQWRYEAAHLNGAPLPVIMTMTAAFTLE
ncbi:MAG TPA: TonB family protein [Vicinamibacterales bacterium]|jgi:TonB family protein|nr:TonB family protein [Vicinamibacterales bacterium]